MSLPPIQIQIVAGGLSEVLASLKTVEKAQIQAEQRTTKLQKSELTKRLADLKSYEREAINSQKRIADSVAPKASRRGNEQLSSERKLTDGLVKEHRRRGSQLRDVMKQLGLNGQSNSSNVAGKLMSSGGGSSGGGGGISSLLKGLGGEGGGMAGISGEALVAGAGVATIAVGAVVAYKKAMEILADGIRMGVNEFADAILEIGGGFKVSSAIAQGERNKRKATEIAVGSFGGVSPDALQKTVKGLSSGSEKSRDEWNQAAEKWHSLTGDLDSFGRLGKDFETTALVTKSSLADTANMYGNIKAMKPDMSDDELLKIGRVMIGANAKGAIDLKDTNQIGEAVALTGQMEGGVNARNVQTMMSHLQMVKGGAGVSPSEAATMEKEIIKGMVQVSQKNPALAAKYGIDVHEGKIQDYDGAVKRMVAGIQNDENVMKALGGKGGAYRGLTGIANQAGIKSGDSNDVISAKIDARMKEFGPVTQGQMDAGASTIKGTADSQIKTAFEEMKRMVEDEVNPSFERLVPMLKAFTGGFSNETGNIRQAANVIVDTFEVLMTTGQALEGTFRTIAEVILNFGAATMRTVAAMEGVVAHLPGTDKDKWLNAAASADKLAGSLDKLAFGISHPGALTNEKPKSFDDIQKDWAAGMLGVPAGGGPTQLGPQAPLSPEMAKLLSAPNQWKPIDFSQLGNGQKPQTPAGSNSQTDQMAALFPDAAQVAKDNKEAARLQLEAARKNLDAANKATPLPSNGLPPPQGN